MNESADPHVPLSPYQPPASPVWMPPVEAPSAGPRPVPFEDLEALPGFWARVGAMFQLVFTRPLELFDRVPVTDGLGAPWRFLLLLSVPVFLIVAAVFFFLGMGALAAQLEARGGTEGPAVVAFLPLILGGVLLLMPLFSFLGMVVGGALNHACLWMWGGLRRSAGVHQTIRAYGYASAFLQIGALVPYLGALIQLAGMVVIGIGLARLHKTDTWRGVCAALTPLLLVCCCLGGILALVILPLVASGHH